MRVDCAGHGVDEKLVQRHGALCHVEEAGLSGVRVGQRLQQVHVDAGISRTTDRPEAHRVDMNVCRIELLEEGKLGGV